MNQITLNKKKILLTIIFINLIFFFNLQFIKKEQINDQNFTDTQNVVRTKRNLFENNCPLDWKSLTPKIEIPQNDLLEQTKEKIIINWQEKIKEGQKNYLQKINLQQTIKGFDLYWIQNLEKKLILQDDQYRTTLYSIIGKEKNKQYLTFLTNLNNAKTIITKLQEIIPKIVISFTPHKDQTLTQYKEMMEHTYQEIKTKINNFENQYQTIENQYFINLESFLKTKINVLWNILKEDLNEIKNLVNLIIEKKDELIDPKPIDYPESIEINEEQTLNTIIKNYIMFQNKNEIYLNHINKIEKDNLEITNNINQLNERLCVLLKKINR